MLIRTVMKNEFDSSSDFEVTDIYEPNISSPDFSNLPPNPTANRIKKTT